MILCKTAGLNGRNGKGMVGSLVGMAIRDPNRCLYDVITHFWVGVRTPMVLVNLVILFHFRTEIVNTDDESKLEEAYWCFV